MNFVEPIRDIAMIEMIKVYLKEKNYRDFVLFVTGIYTGLRISDLLELKVKDVSGMDFISIREIKTNKKTDRWINEELKDVYKVYTEGKHEDEYLFCSRQGGNVPICRSMAYKIMVDIGERFNLKSIGTHTMRKTFGYHFNDQTGKTDFLQKMFNHQSLMTTLDYIGMTKEMMKEEMGKCSY